MSQFSDYAKLLLSGGLPAVLDSQSASKMAQGDTRPEQTAPASTITDAEPFSTRLKNLATPGNIAIGAAALLALGGFIWLIRR